MCGQNINFVSLRYETQLLQHFGALRARGEEIDAGGLDGGMAQHVGQLCHIPAHPVKRSGKQMPQVVEEYLGGRPPARWHSPFTRTYAVQ